MFESIYTYIRCTVYVAVSGISSKLKPLFCLFQLLINEDKYVYVCIYILKLARKYLYVTVSKVFVFFFLGRGGGEEIFFKNSRSLGSCHEQI